MKTLASQTGAEKQQFRRALGDAGGGFEGATFYPQISVGLDAAQAKLRGWSAIRK